MNLEIEIPGLKIKLEYAEKKHIDRAISAVMHYAQGGRFEDVYDVAQQYVEKVTPKSEKKFIEAVNGVKNYPNGSKGYQCSYSCTCGNKGVRYISEDDSFCECHKCKESLIVTPATENDGHDEYFNYFLAY